MRREAGFPARGPAHGGNHAGCDSRRIKSSDDAMTLDKARAPKNVFGLGIERRRRGYICARVVARMCSSYPCLSPPFGVKNDAPSCPAETLPNDHLAPDLRFKLGGAASSTGDHDRCTRRPPRGFHGLLPPHGKPKTFSFLPSLAVCASSLPSTLHESSYCSLFDALAFSSRPRPHTHI